MKGMFEDFSRGYYLGRMYVEPHEADSPVMQDEEFEKVRNDIYGDERSYSVEKTAYNRKEYGDVKPYDAKKPLVVKIGKQHLVVDGDEGVPTGTLGVPHHVAERLRIRNPPSVEDVLIAKKGHATRILSLIGFGDGREPS